MGLINIKSVIVSDPGEMLWEIDINGNTEVIAINFSENVRQFIVVDRCDAMVLGLLMFAIKHQMDITSTLPISETLLYKLKHHYIPGICSDKVYNPRILVRTVPDMISEGNIVATGVSCGVDSMYTVKEHTLEISDDFKLNHLVFLNAGSHHTGQIELRDKLYKGRRDNAINFSNKLNLPVIEISSQLPLVLENYSGYSHPEHHTFMMLACLLSIQKGLKRFYYSGAFPYQMFNCEIKNDSELSCGHYDLFTLWTASNAQTEFYSTGGSLSRLEKVAALKGYKPSEEFLNVCVAAVDNCGQCFKCKRTLLEIDASGMIDDYGEVFDIEEYKKTRKKRIQEGYRGAFKGDELLKELDSFFMSELTSFERFLNRVRVRIGRIVSYLRKK